MQMHNINIDTIDLSYPQEVFRQLRQAVAFYRQAQSELHAFRKQDKDDIVKHSVIAKFFNRLGILRPFDDFTITLDGLDLEKPEKLKYRVTVESNRFAAVTEMFSVTFGQDKTTIDIKTQGTDPYSGPIHGSQQNYAHLHDGLMQEFRKWLGKTDVTKDAIPAPKLIMF